ncbi:MAG: hypothetical protein NW205_01000 [Hyphomicrobiaceae bacterium]|nr:hypothetical protein [Hyphomicrobiaceae bacterium]
MTRDSVNARLRAVYFWIGLVLVLSLGSAFAPLVDGLPQGVIEAAAKLYDLLRDMSLLIATLAAAYLANVFQKRASFVAALEEEWRNIVRTKTALYAYCEKPDATQADYLAAFCRLSDTIDTMRVVYRNAGETDALVGLYPYAPLHDMRRALQSIDPRKRAEPAGDGERKLVRDAILQSFYALRETFLEELDLEEPRHPLLISGARRLKTPGAADGARARQIGQRERLVARGGSGGRADIDALLAGLYEAESASERAAATVEAARRAG